MTSDMKCDIKIIVYLISITEISRGEKTTFTHFVLCSFFRFFREYSQKTEFIFLNLIQNGKLFVGVQIGYIKREFISKKGQILIKKINNLKKSAFYVYLRRSFFFSACINILYHHLCRTRTMAS